ncbi:MAG TPA: DUF4038 domain-containing protein [bacterium]|nr:DUF4038 domain-containing protein [bacterium]HPG44038.1 DUF4038 domain-containing protein [bacterium]HPM96405.1 DUF4038 domain-containing protein [bacterium]
MFSRLIHGIILLLLLIGWRIEFSWAQIQSSLVIDDPLTGSSISQRVNGGVFSQEGWKTTTRNDCIRYDIETCPYGMVEFDVKGLYESNVVFPNIQYDRQGMPTGQEDMHYTLFNMYDRDEDRSWFGQAMPSGIVQWHNPYKVVMHLFGYVAGDQYKWRHGRFRANVAAFNGGYEDDPHAFEIEYGPVFWQREKTFHMKVEWGNGLIKYYADDTLRATCDYSAFGEEYAPPDHSLMLGSANSALGITSQVPINVTFSNFKFYRFTDSIAPQVVSSTPIHNTTDASVDSYVSIRFDEPIDLASATQAFGINPSLPGELKQTGNVLYYQFNGFLQEGTTYTITLSTALKDKAGNAMQSPYTFSFTTGQQVPATVAKYDIIEVPVTVSGITNNKYTTVAVKGVFQGPTRRIEIGGFWDGGDVWKVRMAPTEVGQWNYTITGPTSAFSKSGSFNCVDSDAKGFIVVNPDYPYTFMYEDGTPFMWKGETSWRAMLNSVPYESRFKDYIDLRSSQGYNVVQSILVSYINGDGFWANEGGPVFALTPEGKDYERLNPEYFKWVDRRIEYMLSKGMHPCLLFTWAQEFAKFSSTQFARYAKYLVARYAAYPVFWNICGEYNEVYTDYGMSPNVFRDHGGTIRAADPYDHPITLHPTGRSSSAEYASDAWFSFIMQQTPYWHQDILRDRVSNKPVVNGEYGYAGWNTDDDVRIGAWEVLTAGGYITAGFFTTFAPDKGGWDLNANLQQQLELQFINSFFDDTHWWEMNPHDELTNNGTCLAAPGKEYIIYSRYGGPVAVNLSHVNSTSTIQVEWLNPRELTYSERFEVQGGASRSFTPPFSGDWVLHIGQGVPRDSVPPLAPNELVLDNRSLNSISFSWLPPLPAADGETASSYRILRNGNFVASVTETHYTDSGLDAETSYQYEVYAVDSKRNISESAATATFATLSDTQPPYLVNVTIDKLTEVVVVFNEPVDSLSAQNAANYRISPSVLINSATLQSDGRSVVLATAGHQAGTMYTLFVSNIKDRASSPNTILPNSLHSYRFNPSLQVTNLTPARYRIDTLRVMGQYYIDRNFVIKNVPSGYENALLICTANEDKTQTAMPFLTFHINVACKISVAYERGKSLPAWLAEGWQKNGQTLFNDDDTPLDLYVKEYNPGTIGLGGNEGDSSSSMYVVLVQPSTTQDSTPPAPPTGLVIEPIY